MRLPSVALVATAFALACADAPTTPLLHQPDSPTFRLDYPPPPFALIEGVITTDGTGDILASLSLSSVAEGGALMSHSGADAGVYRGWLLVTPGGRTAILRFAEDGQNVTFSKGATISKTNGKVTGRGTVTIGGHTYDLRAVTEFEANGECASTPWDANGPSCASFSAGDESFSSQLSVWTGTLSNDGEGFDGVPRCTATADFVVTDQAQFFAALAAVNPGGTIAIDGMIELSTPALIDADDIRVTCATLGSGLISSSGPTPFALIHVSGDGVQVDNLFLSSEPTTAFGGAANTVFVNSGADPVERFRLRLNRIRCGNNGTCAFLVGAPGAVVSENLLESLGTVSGIHVQQGGGGPNPVILTDNTVVERNNIVAPTVSGSPLFGAIRVRDGSGLVVRYNATSGIWLNGIAVAELDGALIQDNFIRDAIERGIIGSTNSPSPLSVRNSIIRGNRISGPQTIGINLIRACWNRVENNDVTVAPGALRAKFEATTGANVYVGNPASVVDQGSFDCDGDGFTDPNTISGSTGPSSSSAATARIPAGSLRSFRSDWQSYGTKYPELQ